MQIFPATDILGGKVVRLTKGDYNQVKIYADSPAEMAALPSTLRQSEKPQKSKTYSLRSAAESEI